MRVGFTVLLSKLNLKFISPLPMHAIPEERREMREKDEEFKKRLADSKRSKMLITFLVIIGVRIVVGNNAAGLLVLFILYVIGFWN